MFFPLLFSENISALCWLRAITARFALLCTPSQYDGFHLFAHAYKHIIIVFVHIPRAYYCSLTNRPTYTIPATYIIYRYIYYVSKTVWFTLLCQGSCAYNAIKCNYNKREQHLLLCTLYHTTTHSLTLTTHARPTTNENNQTNRAQTTHSRIKFSYRLTKVHKIYYYRYRFGSSNLKCNLAKSLTSSGTFHEFSCCRNSVIHIHYCVQEVEEKNNEVCSNFLMTEIKVLSSLLSNNCKFFY